MRVTINRLPIAATVKEIAPYLCQTNKNACTITQRPKRKSTRIPQCIPLFLDFLQAFVDSCMSALTRFPLDATINLTCIGILLLQM